MSSVAVSALHLYPLKSAGGINRNLLPLDARGPVADRRWMLVDGRGRFITMRKFPKMIQIDIGLHDGTLVVNAPGMSELQIPTPSFAQQQGLTKKSVIIWHDEVAAVDIGEAAAGWFSAYLGVSCYLVYMPDDTQRQVDLAFANVGTTVGFADGFPLLLISEASLADLNQRLPSGIPMSRFRPNIVVSGCEAFAEDDWREIRIGELTLSVVKPCSRCIMPSIDAATASKSSEPMATLKTYRQQDGEVFFGQNLVHQGPGSVEVGAKVEVLK